LMSRISGSGRLSWPPPSGARCWSSTIRAVRPPVAVRVRPPAPRWCLGTGPDALLQALKAWPIPPAAHPALPGPGDLTPSELSAGCGYAPDRHHHLNALRLAGAAGFCRRRKRYTAPRGHPPD
jgi:hypothetical protein